MKNKFAIIRMIIATVFLTFAINGMSQDAQQSQSSQQPTTVKHSKKSKKTKKPASSQPSSKSESSQQVKKSDASKHAKKSSVSSKSEPSKIESSQQVKKSPTSKKSKKSLSTSQKSEQSEQAVEQPKKTKQPKHPKNTEQTEQSSVSQKSEQPEQAQQPKKAKHSKKVKQAEQTEEMPQTEQLTRCNCPVEKNEINFKNKVIICSNYKQEISPGNWYVKNFVVMDCTSHKTIDDNAADGVTPFIIKDCKDSLVEIFTTYLPDSTMMSYVPVPLYYASIKVKKNNGVKISPDRYCFNSFGITKYQEKYVNNLCDSLQYKINRKDSNFAPYNEHAIYALFLGAINYNERATYLLKNIKKYFNIHDVSLLETIDDQIPYEAVMENN